MAIDTRTSGSTGSALPELAGIGAVALVAMALLTFGYKHRGYDTAHTATPASTQTTGAASEQMTKPTLPRSNPADLANPPTSFPGASGNPTDPTRNSPANPANPAR